MVKLSYDRTTIAGKGYLGKRGYKPQGIVIHNDAGSGTAINYKNQLVNAGYNRLANGVAHSYISGTTVWQALPESYVAWHTANQNGNLNYYGIEVCQSMSASDNVFKTNEQSAFKETARMLKKWGLKPNRNTVRLHVEFSQTACPHRSMTLHTGFNPVTQGAPSQATINKLKDYFITQVNKYYTGKDNSVTPSTPKGWSKNAENGVLYKKVNKKFKVGNAPITTRIGSPFLSSQSGGQVKPKQTMNFDYLCRQDGYEWGQLENNKGQQEFVPIRPLNQKEYWGVLS